MPTNISIDGNRSMKYQLDPELVPAMAALAEKAAGAPAPARGD